jgi:hypothetical protein
MMIAAKEQFGRQYFVEKFTMAAWLIWKERNAFIFQNINPSPQNWRTAFIHLS